MELVLNKPTAILPQSLGEIMQLAKLLSTSTILPKDYLNKEGNIVVAIQWGMEIGLAPLQAMQNIAVINGRPSLWGDALLALCLANGADVSEEESDDGKTWVCTVRRKGRPEVVRKFTWDDAVKAGLSSRDTYKKHPKRMVQMRARGFALRDACADILKGIISAEENEDIRWLEKSKAEDTIKIVNEELPAPEDTVKTHPSYDEFKDQVEMNEIDKSLTSVVSSGKNKFEHWSDAPQSWFERIQEKAIDIIQMKQQDTVNGSDIKRSDPDDIEKTQDDAST